MNEQKRPRAREKRIVNTGNGVEKQGEGLGGGPVNNVGNYEKRREPANESATPSQQSSHRAPAVTPSGQTARPTQPSVEQNRVPGGFPRQQSGRNSNVGSVSQFGGTAQNQPQGRTAQHGSNPLSGAQRPGQTGGSFGISMSGSGTSQNSAQRPSSSQRTGSGSNSRPVQTGGGIPQNRPSGSTVQHGSSQRSGGQRSGGSGKLMLIIAVLVVLFGGGRLGGLFGGSQETPQSYTNSGTNSYGTTQSGNDSNSYDTSSQSGSQQSGLGTGAESISNLLNMLMGSGSSPYDFTGSFESMTGSTQGQSAVSTGSGDTQADMSVASSAREKYTRILGNGKDVMTILVYMCGTDLESQNGMGTADLKEMAKATLSENVNLIVYTGGCRRWRNSVVSSSVNQIYQIRDGGLYCLEKDMGSAAMTTPSTLTSFIQYGQEHFPANRMALILWDHGGGSVSGYGYDEKNGRSSMTLAGIDNALKAAKVKFDFIGFDACLMATIENGLMLGQYADYMIASEETEPGVGWYYTGWLNEVSKNPGMATTAIGKKIVDDFVRVCAEQCRGQSTTLSTVDLAELSATVPGALKAFSEDMSAQIQEKDYQLVATARAGTREFAQSTKIDQIDLVHFAKNLGSTAGKQLADAIEGAVKYNRCGGGMTNANGLSIYFPYRRVAKVSQMVQTYEAIGMDETYSRCIQAFASMEVSGQVAAGTPISSYGTGSGSGSMIGGLMGSLLGGGIGTSSTVSYGSDGMADLIGSLFSGSAGGLDASGLADLFGARALSTETALETINENHLDAGALQWENGRITLSEDQWGMVESIVKNMFIDDGKGFIDLGCDSDFRIEGDALIAEDDGTWLSINGQPVAYYYLGTSEEGESYRIEGYVPCMLNGERARLMIVFDDEHPYGIIAGAQKDYGSDETDTQAKNMISIGAGDQVRFICDYYDYDENYQNTYYLGNPMTLGDEIEIANTPVGEGRRVTYCLTDLYQTQYWTPAL